MQALDAKSVHFAACVLGAANRLAEHIPTIDRSSTIWLQWCFDWLHDYTVDHPDELSGDVALKLSYAFDTRFPDAARQYANWKDQGLL